MKSEGLFSKKIFFFQQCISSRQEAIRIIADEMLENDLVSNEFYDRLLERERKYPTGLLNEAAGIGFALVHADREYVQREQIGFMSFREPVIFERMDNREEVEVRFVFVLALKDASTHMSMLGKLMTLLGQEKYLGKLLNVKTQEEFMQWLESGELL